MTKTTRIRKTAILGLVLASFLFTAGAGQATTMERAPDGDFGSHIVSRLVERVGNFVSAFAVEVIEIFTKEGSELDPNG